MRNRMYEEWKRKIKQSGKEKRIPVCGQFELTARCNFDCKMCYIHNQESNSYRNLELSTEQWKRIFDEAYEAGMMFATLTGGECLLREDFRELYLHLWHKRIMITVLTNGALIDDSLLEFFKQYRPDAIQISLYGCSEECYRKVTGHTGFSRVFANVEKLIEAGLDVRVVVTPSKYIAPDYINTLKLVQERGIPMRMMELLLFPKRYDQEDDEHYLSADEMLELATQRAELQGELIPASETPKPCGSCDQCPQGLVCNAGHGLAHITWQGEMHPCVNAMVGGASLLEMNYEEAWAKTKQAADNVLRGIECVDCPYDKICFKCPTHRLLDFSGGHCNPEVCELMRKLVAAGVKKLEQPAESCD